MAHIRWMIRRDMPEVMEAERLCHEDAWTEDQFIACLQQRNCIGMVAEIQEFVVGYMVYELYKNHLWLVNLAVHPKWQGQGIGREMVEKLKGKLSTHRRSAIHMKVSERCQGAHFFLRKMGFRATRVERNFFLVGGEFEDAYHFRFVLGHPYRHERAVEELLCQGK